MCVVLQSVPQQGSTARGPRPAVATIDKGTDLFCTGVVTNCGVFAVTAVIAGALFSRLCRDCGCGVRFATHPLCHLRPHNLPSISAHINWAVFATHMVTRSPGCHWLSGYNHACSCPAVRCSCHSQKLSAAAKYAMQQKKPAGSQQLLGQCGTAGHTAVSEGSAMENCTPVVWLPRLPSAVMALYAVTCITTRHQHSTVGGKACNFWRPDSCQHGSN